MPFINIATEDELAENIASRMVSCLLPSYELGLRLRRGGVGYLRASLSKFRSMAQREHVCVLTDLDRVDCAPMLVNAWRGDEPFPPQLILRVCVREVEAWILADRIGFAQLIGASVANMPKNPDELEDPKRFLLNLTSRRGSRVARSELLASRGAVASQGLGYNRLLGQFVTRDWSLDRAREHSRSLDKAAAKLSSLEDV
jgi:hypothetical protein